MAFSPCFGATSPRHAAFDGVFFSQDWLVNTQSIIDYDYEFGLWFADFSYFLYGTRRSIALGLTLSGLRIMLLHASQNKSFELLVQFHWRIRTISVLYHNFLVSIKFC